jgi:hypothetical protein
MGLAAMLKTEIMKDDKQQQHEPKDIALDVPAEANTEKHINFLKEEEDSSTKVGVNADSFAAERQKQWKEGLEEGEKARRNNE